MDPLGSNGKVGEGGRCETGGVAVVAAFLAMEA